MNFDSLKELSHSKPILFYDGLCKLCNGAVRFVLRHERTHCIIFSSLTSPAGRELKEYFADNFGEMPDSIVWMEKGRVFVRSDVILKVIPHLKWYCKGLAIIGILPTPVRDLLYQWIARYRYKWFGKYETCPLPDQKDVARFIE